MRSFAACRETRLVSKMSPLVPVQGCGPGPSPEDAAHQTEGDPQPPQALLQAGTWPQAFPFPHFASGQSKRGEGNGTHSSTLAWKIPWTEEPGGLQSLGSLRVGQD